MADNFQITQGSGITVGAWESSSVKYQRIVPIVDGASGFGKQVYSVNDGQNTGQVIKNAAGKVYGWYIMNNGSGTRRVKLYNKATAPTSADTPVLRLAIPAGLGANLSEEAGFDIFSNGIGIRCVQGVADNDNTAPTANDLEVNIWYK